MKLSIALVSVAFKVAIISPGLAAVSSVSDDDKAFVAQVSQNGLFESKASDAAGKKDASKQVADFAKMEVLDHGKINQELLVIATNKKVGINLNLKPELKEEVDKLNKLSGGKLDKVYLREMDRMHKKDRAIFAREARRGRDAQLKAFAGKTVAIVQRHLDMLSRMKSP